MTESEVLVLRVLKEKSEKHPGMAFTASEIGEDPLFLSRSTPTYRPTMSAGSVLGSLRKKKLINVVLLLDEEDPVRFYKINNRGISKLESLNRVQQEYQRLLENYRQFKDLANKNLQALEEFKENHGIK